jgi:hypothetical protein
MISEQELRRKLDEIRLELDKAKDLIEDADPRDHIDRADAIVKELRSSVAEPVKTHSIMELKGLGKEIWLSNDVDKYIREERKSWG